MNKEITFPVALTSLIGFGIVGGIVVSAPTAASGQTAAPAPVSATPARGSDAYAYRGPVFGEFVETSYKEAPKADRPEFYAWMQEAYDSSHVRFRTLETQNRLDGLLAAVRTRYDGLTDPEQKTLLEKQTGAFFHRVIKKTIRHFSLDRGFEFRNIVDRHERQCFAQATLIAALMQRAGMHAGVVMVTRSDKGEESNNGHAVTLVKLSNGHDLLVDASHKTPFIKQQGLMVADSATGAYRFVAPQYDVTGDQIVGYAPLSIAGPVVATAAVRDLDVPFMKSQFDYYRGERTPGGFFAKKKSTEGLADSERFFTRSIAEDPGNPLPAYALGRVELREGKNDEARKQIVAAYGLYSRYGYIPDGAREALALVQAAPQALTMR
jgi:hypothetical protein